MACDVATGTETGGGLIMMSLPAVQNCVNLPYNFIGEAYMKGSIHYRKDRRYHYVSWYWKGGRYKIYKYQGTICYDRRMAEKLLACMQGDVENGVFRLEKYLGSERTDVIPYLYEWLDAIEPRLSPATYKDYFNSVLNHIEPFFKKYPIQLHEIGYDTLIKLMNHIKRDGKGKLNVMYCLHACLTFAWRSNRHGVRAVPPFPERHLYNVVEPVIEWLPEERQDKVIKAIPAEHQPIFWWLKYHLRRPSEAMALYKDDYDPHDDVFIVQRAFSNKQLVDRTKTSQIHVIPCHAEFKSIMERMPKSFGPFFFVNPYGKLKGKHYQHDYLTDLWNKACAETGEHINLYAGTKHSSCTQMVVEHGYNLHDVQIATDHARLDSVRKYAKVEVSARRALLERRKVVSIKEGKTKQRMGD